ncbi:hypothetical protein [uncultured Algoriphagus sp.]|uniref:hypothetical protein n=1 Tax=uncultured Algoriphagus sp. TaxID=417365 RepID=UPI002588D7BD|nr:hypothetical protein [uncultured Algoriphagus sp.]
MNSIKTQTNAKIPAFWLDSKIQRYTASSQITSGSGHMFTPHAAFGKAPKLNFGYPASPEAGFFHLVQYNSILTNPFLPA